MYISCSSNSDAIVVDLSAKHNYIKIMLLFSNKFNKKKFNLRGGFNKSSSI